MKKGYLQISFGWLFAIITGIFIIFLAVYSASIFIKDMDKFYNTESSKDIEVLLNPLEIGFETGKTTLIRTQYETRIYNRCDLFGSFGRQFIKTSRKSSNKWTEEGVEINFKNKYIFSEDIIEGKDFYVFSKPFYFPFKISDLIYLTSSKKEYCFYNSPEKINNELKALNQKNIFLSNCPGESIKICFSPNFGNDCDIKVDYGSKVVRKNNKNLYFYSDSLMYAAIFSSPEIYECQLKRLMNRTKQLSFIYKDKAILVKDNAKCSSNLNLFSLINSLDDLKSSANLNSISVIVEEINKKNDMANCRLW
jgi:hypothetical protein